MTTNKVCLIAELLTVLFITIIPISLRADMTNKKIQLPETITMWTRSEAARIVDPSNIFQYMNGGGELYLAYRFILVKINPK